MSDNRQWDNLQFDGDLNFPYNRILGELSNTPRFVRGNNACITLGGKLIRRPGTLSIDNTTLARRIDRLWLYETLDTPPKVYLIASAYNSSTTRWELYYIRLSDASPAWTLFTSLRDCNNSTRPHELVVSRGLAYIKGFPSSGSTEKLGTIIFDGKSSPVRFMFWGLLGPTTPAAVKGATTRLAAAISSSATTISVVSSTGFPATPFTIQVEDERMSVTAVAHPNWTVTRAIEGTTAASHEDDTLILWRNWTASDHRVDVNITWRYTYAYKSLTGQISNRAPLETNPDKLPSSTGPFQDLCPTMTYAGTSDTVNVPTIVFYRTQDGGGTFFKLKEFANPGSGTFDFRDDDLESGAGGGTFNDPLPDDQLDGATQATSLTSNSPPPTVLDPQVVGVDTPIASTPIVSYAARLWYGLGNVLFFSAEEELNDGIPEESFPSGIFGNFFRFQYPITNLAATDEALYVFTIQATYMITGNNLESLNVTPLFDNLGCPYGHPRAITRFANTIALLTHDFRIATIEGGQYKTISDPLFTDIVDATLDSTEFDIKYWGDLEKEWLVVSGHVISNTELSQQWVYDLKKSKQIRTDFWFVPWTVRSVASVSGRINEGTGQRRLVWFVYNQSTDSGQLVRLDPTERTATDWFNGAETNYNFYVDLWLMTVPAGNHVNELRKGGITPTVYAVMVERTLFANDQDPLMYYYQDDFWSDPIPFPTIEDPPRRERSLNYKTMVMPIHQAVQRFGMRFSKVNSSDLFEVHSINVIWNPDAGA